MRTFIGLVVALAVVGCQYPGPKVPSREQLSLDYAREMKLEFGLNLLENKMSEKTISFDFYHYAEVEALEARFLIHNAAKELAKHMSIQEKDLSITISFIDPISHHRYKRNNIAIVALQNQRIHYSIYNSASESFEEVLQEDFVSL